MYIILYLDDTFFRCFYNVMYNKYYVFFAVVSRSPSRSWRSNKSRRVTSPSKGLPRVLEEVEVEAE